MKQTVLIIDDDIDLTKIVQINLEREGFKTVVASSGVEGLQKAYSSQPDLVILDIMMPGMDGWTTCRRLREISDVPIIMLTARGMESDVVKGLELGADDYIIKPFGNKELLARINALLRRADASATKRPPIYSDGELVVDFVKRMVTVRDEQVDLTPTEFKLLSTFVQNEGRVLPHRFLLTQVWGPEYADEVNYLKLYVRYLRQKIEKDPSNPAYILTEWGVGYRFKES
ncbi:MAG: response regulator transcription factor [Chloroflexota bacterium]